MVRAFVGVGSNIDPEGNVPRALGRLARDVAITGVSTFHRTPALGRPEQDDYYNGVVAVETGLDPLALRGVLRRVESACGRVRTADKWAARTIDLDVLVHGDRVLRTPELTLPDPDLLDRPFLALPLRELAPDLVLPGDGRRIVDVARGMDASGMTALPAFTARVRGALQLDEPA